MVDPKAVQTHAEVTMVDDVTNAVNQNNPCTVTNLN